MLQKLLLIPCFVMLLCGCADKYKTIFTDKLVVNNNYRHYEDTVLPNPAGPLLYSRIYRPNTFGLRTSFQVPEQSQGKNLYVVVSGRSRTDYGQSNAVIVVVTNSRKNEQISWDFIQMKYEYTDINKWCTFRDSLKLPPNFYGTEYSQVTVMAHLPKGNEKFDLDGLNVTITEKQ